eukprot:6483887-Amphidinium_carterae.1
MFGPISSWDTSRVTDMSFLFVPFETFNSPIGGWNTTRVTSMAHMFEGAADFDQDIGHWNTENVRDMSFMFYRTARFDHDISKWDTGRVTDMSYMFANSLRFGQDISAWNVSSVSNMTNMFQGALSVHKWPPWALKPPILSGVSLAAGKANRLENASDESAVHWMRSPQVPDFQGSLPLHLAVSCSVCLVLGMWFSARCRGPGDALATAWEVGAPLLPNRQGPSPCGQDLVPPSL